MLATSTYKKLFSNPLMMLIVSFSLFGFMPIYWAQLSHVDTDVILFYRALMTVITLLYFVFFKFGIGQLADLIKKKWPYLIISMIFIALNWLTYIYAVNHQHLFEGSLGYFLTPLISVILGYVLLREKVSKRQVFAVALVFTALLYLIISKGIIPKYALVIAISFSFYGILGRVLKAPIFPRIFIENLGITVLLLIMIPSKGLILTHFFENDITTKFFLLLSGLATIIPFCLYAEGVNHVKFATVGMLSFLFPTIVFFVSIFYFHEDLDKEKLITIMVIWPSIGLYISALFQPKKLSAIQEFQ